MFISETTIPLDRPSRYLIQLCKHAAAMGTTGGGHRPRNHAAGEALARGELQVTATYSDTHGTITFAPWGRATLTAGDAALTVRVEAADTEALTRIQGILTRDLERFGRRDQLTVAWTAAGTYNARPTPRSEPRMTTIDVPGARLHYDECGSGPLLLLIPGAGGDARPFTALVGHLQADYRVITYDRRGFSRSILDGPQDYEHRLDTDADDAHAIIEHCGAPAAVLGSSSGALVALRLLSRRPEACTTVVAYEPPAMRYLPDGQQWIEFFHQVYDHYRTCGTAEALDMFRQRTFSETDRQAMARNVDLTQPRTAANVDYWYEHELRQYPATEYDLDVLARHAERIVWAVGQQSAGLPCYRATIELAQRLSSTVTELPGGHIGFATDPAEFATALRSSLARWCR